MTRSIIVLVALVATLVGSTATSDATIIVRKDLARLTQEAERIVIARSVSRRSSFVADGRLVYTHTTFEIERTLKGKATKRIVVSEPGGKLAGMTYVVPGMPNYKIGKRVLLMVKKDELKLWRTHGLIQGKFDLKRDAATGSEFVRQPKGLEHVMRPAFAKDDFTASGAIDIEDFEDKLQDIMRRASKASKKASKPSRRTVTDDAARSAEKVR